MTRTKIVGTIGPASNNESTISKLIDAGLNVARVNFSHGERGSITEMVERLRAVARSKGKLLAILGDLQGPKLRVGKVPNGQIDLQVGQQLILSAVDVEPSDKEISFPHPELFSAINQGARLVIGDGEMELKVMGKDETRLYTTAMLDGPLGSRKGVNLPGTRLPIPSITEKDMRDLQTAIDLDLDYVALSFVRSSDDIHELRTLMREYGGNIPIIAKIEKEEAIDCLDEILAACDGMMVARGDLGIDMPAYEVPFLQKEIIRKCNAAGKPVITATQMLQSMTEYPQPTRAEATDVANAILDGTDAVMLSAETASGLFPVKSVMMMSSIARIAEKNFPYSEWNDRRSRQYRTSVTETTDAISSAASGIAYYTEVAAIVSTTVSGYTARQVARWRPPQRLIGLTPSERTQRRLALVWGVEPVLIEHFGTIDGMIEDVAMALRGHGFKAGDRIVITAGVPFGRRGLTNMIQVHELSDAEVGERA